MFWLEFMAIKFKPKHTKLNSVCFGLNLIYIKFSMFWLEFNLLPLIFYYCFFPYSFGCLPAHIHD